MIYRTFKLIIKSLAPLLVASLAVLSIAACNESKVLTSIEQAQLIRLAINNNDTKKLLSLSSLPLFIREQEWVTANDGYGFMLGKAKQNHLTTDDEFNQYFNTSINTVHIPGEQVITEDITTALFADELKDTNSYWNKLNLHLLKRGEGDVEHIVLLGLDKDTKKLRAIYMN